MLDRLRDWDRQTASRVTHFVAISRTVPQRIAECYGRESTVIYPPVDTDFYTPDDGPREDYYLCVSALAPYKRIDLAIEACNRLQRPLADHRPGPAAAGGSKGWPARRVSLPRLAAGRGDPRPPAPLPGLALSRRRGLRHRAAGSAGVRGAGDRLGRGGALETVLPATPSERGTGVMIHEPSVESLCDAMLRFEGHSHQLCPRLARQQALRFSKVHYEEQLVSYLHQAAATFERIA